jgi:aspartyl-tRNA(Asn)/glutamyl-tRNA(Gln) amidotransferase subunit B
MGLAGNVTKYQSFIGLEVHIHLLTKSKVFCGCRSAFGDEPNTNICPVCMGHPGVLPLLNLEAMRMGCTVAKALNCRIPEKTWFERKQYFYPDMTKNYQISQFASPLGQQGEIELEGKIEKGGGLVALKKKVRIRECHLEEDAGKMIHTGNVSLIDYNRAGVSLLEIVTEPDMECGEEAELFIQQLRRMVRYLGVCDGNMEMGSLRADANVSINTPGAGLGKKVEIKNLNSSRFVKLGLNYEIVRQSAALDAGKTIIQETRLWNENRDQTEPMRNKENANDYRYFPEPDLPVFSPDAKFLKDVEDHLVELPVPRSKRLIDEYNISDEQAFLITEERAFADYFEAAVENVVRGGIEKLRAASLVANKLLTDIKHILTTNNIALSEILSKNFKLTPEKLAALLIMVEHGEVSAKNVRGTIDIILKGDTDLTPQSIIEKNGWQQINDSGIIKEIVKKVFDIEEKTLIELRELKSASGELQNPKREATLCAYLVGKVIAQTKGRADPVLTKKIVLESL